MKAFQTIVTVDDTAIEVVQVACSKTAAIELNHRTQIRRNDRNDIHDHPFWLVAALEEGFTDIETAHDVAFFLEARLRLECCPQFLRQFFHIDFVEQFLDGFGTNADAESIPEFIQFFLVFGFCEELLFCQVRIARIKDDVACKIEDLFKGALTNVKDGAHAAGNPLEIPDVGDRSSKLNGAHAVTTDFCPRDFDAALVADHTFIADAFVLTAVAFPVLGRAKDAFAEKAVPFWFQRSIVNRFRLRDFAVGPGTDLFRGSQADSHRMKVIYVQQEHSLLPTLHQSRCHRLGNHPFPCCRYRQ